METIPSKWCLKIIFVSLSLCAIGRSTALLAEPDRTPDPISFEELQAHAFANSPLVATIDAKFADALGSATETGILQNPELELEARFPASYSEERGDNEFGVALAQPLRFSDFGTRAQVQRLLNRAASQQQKLDLLEMSQGLFLHYVQLWAVQERLKFVRSLEKVAKKKAGMVVEAQKKGFLGTSEMKLFQGSAARLATVGLGLASDVAASQAALARQASFRFEGRTLLRPELPPVASFSEVQRKSKENALSIQSRVALLERVAQKQSVLARIDSTTGFTPRLLYEHSDDRKDFIGIGVSFQLPFFNRNQGDKLRSKAREREFRIQREYFDGEGFAIELEAMQRSARVAAQQSAKYEKEVFPFFRDALSAAERQFESGQTSVLQLWQTFQEVNSANEEMLQLWVKAFATRSELVLILGEEL